MEVWYTCIEYTTEDQIKNSLFRELFSGLQYTHGSRLYVPLFILKRFVFVMIIVPESLSTMVKIVMMIILQVGSTISIISMCIFTKQPHNLYISYPAIQSIQI